MLKLNGQFDSSYYPDTLGFNYTALRQNPNNKPNQYQYKIGVDAKLYANDQSKSYENILKPKKPGEWIDIVFNNQDLYLYLECIFVVLSRDNDSTKYSISSAELKTTTTLPQNKFSGEYTKYSKDNKNSYEIVRGRRLLAIIPDPQAPIQIYLCPNIFLSNWFINGILKVRI